MTTPGVIPCEPILRNCMLTANDHGRRIILSLVTFAQRHLSLTELLEAVAATRLIRGKDLSRNAIPSREFIDRCEPFLKRSTLETDSDEEFVKITHSVAHKFLISQSDSSNASDPDLTIGLLPRNDPPPLNQSVIADACLNYLLQARYSHMLKKRTVSRFEDRGGLVVPQQCLLSYAAKFWDKHFEALDSSEERCQKIAKFITSSNYITTMQVQSLFVEGHFIQSRDHNGRGLFTKKVWPSWFTKTEDGKKLLRCYHVMIGEWAELLRFGVSRYLNGELDRCFWNSLGPNNFLSANKVFERYPSFSFASTNDADSTELVDFTETISRNGSELIVTKARAQG